MRVELHVFLSVFVLHSELAIVEIFYRGHNIKLARKLLRSRIAGGLVTTSSCDAQASLA